ncbi:hypothetical protein ACFLZZ_02055 [Nanoarchaeota archaeon]
MAYPYAYGAFDFNSVMQQWYGIGLFDVILPIILIFTLVFAILQRTRILGQNKSIDAVVSLVISFFAISNPEVSAFMMRLFSDAALGISILLVFLLIVGFVNARIDPKAWRNVTLFGGLGVFFWTMSRAADFFGGNLIFSGQWWLNNSWWIVPLIMFGFFMFIVVGSGDNEKPGQKIAKARKQLAEDMGVPLQDFYMGT